MTNDEVRTKPEARKPADQDLAGSVAGAEAFWTAAGSDSATPLLESGCEVGGSKAVSPLRSATAVQMALASHTRRNAFLPLPAGEGWGEGERFDCQPPVRTSTSYSSFGFRSSFVIRHSSFVIAAALSLVIAGCGKKHEASPHASANLPAATVRVEVIQLRKLPLTEEVVGTVRTRQAVDLEAKLSGRILTLPVKLGQTVKEGDLLVTLATQEIQARLEQAEAALRQSETDFQRLTKLRTTGAAMQSELDTATFRQQSAHAAVAEAKALLAYAQITAPMSGVVARKDADVGDLAMPGKPLLRLEDPTNLRLEAEVPNSVLARVKTGAALTVRVDALGLELQGKVAEIAPVADPATRSVRVKLDLPPTPGLLPGQFGRVAVPTAEADFLIVPAAALVRRGQLDLVFVAREGKAQMRIVRTGRTLAAGVEVLSGLNPGESVVVEGAAELLDGQPLNAKGGQ